MSLRINKMKWQSERYDDGVPSKDVRGTDNETTTIQDRHRWWVSSSDVWSLHFWPLPICICNGTIIYHMMSTNIAMHTANIYMCLRRRFLWLHFWSSCQNHEMNRSLQRFFVQNVTCYAMQAIDGFFYILFSLMFWLHTVASNWASFTEDMDIEMWTEVAVVVGPLTYLSDEQM